LEINNSLIKNNSDCTGVVHDGGIEMDGGAAMDARRQRVVVSSQVFFCGFRKLKFVISLIEIFNCQCH
jgi:hypothetical protein